MLEVNKINVSYGDLQVLWDVSFNIEDKEIVTVLGSNGAGKTTTLKTISGLLRPKSGSITFSGTKIDTVPAHKIVEMGLAQVPEGRHLFSFMSVLENLEMGAYTRGARSKMAETFEWVYQLFPILKERKSQLAGTLSGGEQQMLAIGRALMSRPKLLMLDEPSLGLSPKLTSEIFKLMRQINEEGVTVLLVEQNATQALELAERGYVLETGKLVLEGKGKELLKNEHVRKTYLGM